MKLAFLFLVAITSTSIIYGQQFTENGNTWLLNEADAGLSTDNSFLMKIEGDTMINNVIYKTLIRNNDPGSSEWVDVNFLVREDPEGIIYVRFFTGYEGILYDFGLKLGEKVELWNGSLASLESVEIVYGANDEERRKLNVNIELPGSCTLSDSWIEGIGSTGPWPLDFCFAPGYEVTCFYQNASLFYPIDVPYCQEFTPLNSEPEETEVKIFPNPVADVLIIQFEDSPSKSIVVRIISEHGKVLYQQAINDSFLKVDLSRMPGRIFGVQIVTGDGAIITRKVVRV